MAVSVSAKTQTFTNGTANDAAPVDSEFTAAFNNDSTLATALNVIIGTDSVKSGVDGKFIIVRNTFTGSPAAGEHCGIEVERGTTANVAIRFNETNRVWESTTDGTTYSQWITSGGGTFTANPVLAYNPRAALEPVPLQVIDKTFTIANFNYSTPSTLTCAYFSVADSAGTQVLRKTTSTTLDITTSGANGLDTGSKTASIFYYLYAISNANGSSPNLILSATNEKVSGSITLPSGYTLKRQLPFVCRTDSSADLLPWDMGPDGLIMYRNAIEGAPYTVLSAGTATAMTTVVCSSIIPALSQRGYFWIKARRASDTQPIRVRPAGATGAGVPVAMETVAGVTGYGNMTMATNSSQEIAYAGDAAGQEFTISVGGYWITELTE